MCLQQPAGRRLGDKTALRVSEGHGELALVASPGAVICLALFGRHFCRRPRCSPRATSNRICGIELSSVKTNFVARQWDRLPSPAWPLALGTGEPLGSVRLTPIRFPVYQYGPDNPGHIVCQSYRNELKRIALQQL